MNSSIIKGTFVVCILSLITSCTKLKEEPYSFLNRDGFYSTQSEVESAVNGAYAVLPSYILNKLYLNVFADDATSQVDNQLDIFAYDTENAVIAQFWSTCYLAINRANEVLAHADRVPFNTDVNKNRAKGEAKFIRGLMYFYLATYFGDVPLRTEPTVGVENVSKSTSAEVYKLVENDFKEAIDLLPTSASTPAKPNKNIARGFLAKTYLYTKQWNKAALESGTLIQSNQYELVSPYDAIWLKSNENNKELIYSVQNGTTLVNSWLSYLLPQDVSDHPGGKGNHRIEMEKIYIRSFASADTRKTSYDTAYKRANNTIGYTSRGLLEKFIAKSGVTLLDKNLSGLNFPLLRYADIVLIYAEAKARQTSSSIGEPLQWLNTIRRRAYGLPLNTPSAIDLTATTLEGFIALLHQERYWEFGGEGQRWGDLLRTNTFLPIMKAAGKNLIQEKHRYFPIPRVEVISTNGIVTQNPAWE